jgi:hypothetical protein
MVRFFVVFLCPVDVYVWRAICAFILFGARNSNPFPPHDPKTPKTVMQSVMRCGICVKNNLIYFCVILT